jgi:PRTRC genetic system protein A
MTSPPDLIALLSARIHAYHVATAACPVPPDTTPLTWIVAANGTFLRGANRSRQVLVQIDRHRPSIPGLVNLQAGVCWSGYGERLPGHLLQHVLRHARSATNAAGRPVEQQYWIVDRGRGLTVIRPPQLASARMVVTPRAHLPVLCDLHSHHGMDARFSPIDDCDDALTIGVAAVIGRIFTTPTIRTRLTVYGYTEEVPAALIFDDLGPFQDAYQGGDVERP